MTIKLELKGNFLKITDNINNNNRLFIRGITKYEFSNNDTILKIKTEQGTYQVTHRYNVSTLVDGADVPFATFGDLENFLADNLGFSSGGGNGTGVTISQEVDGYSELEDGNDVGELAYVNSSEGTKWLPFSLGGTYYPSGWYRWDGSDWVSDRNNIANELQELSSLIKTGGLVIVDKLSKLPAPVGNVYNLVDDVTYEFINDLDFLGARIVGGSNTTILGKSSENVKLTSTGLGVGVPFFTTTWTTPMRHIAIVDVDTALDIDGLGNNAAYDWTGVNINNVPNIGTIKNFTNFIYSKGAFLSSKGLRFDGAFDTVGIDNSALIGDGLFGDIVEVLPTSVCSRRFRIVYSALVVFGSTRGINVNASATIPDEAFILDTVSVSGGGSYLTGLSDTSNKSLFVNCTGIVNTAVNGQLYMQNNTTTTPVAVSGTFYKVLGTTLASIDNSKYIHSNNRLTNNASVSRKYLIQCNLSFTSGNNKVCEFGFYDSKLSAIREPSRTKSTSNGSGRAENISFNCVVNHISADYLEIWLTNNTDTTSVTVTDMNFVITEII